MLLGRQPKRKRVTLCMTLSRLACGIMVVAAVVASSQGALHTVAYLRLDVGLGRSKSV